MLVTKFIIPIARNIHTNILKYSFRECECCKSITCKKSANPVKSKALSRNENCPRIDVKCAETQNKYICGKETTSAHGSKCQNKLIIDSYQEVYQGISHHSENILKDVRAESESLLNHLLKDIETSTNNEQLSLQNHLQQMKKKLQQLLLIHPTFGSHKRKLAMSLSHQIRQAFNDANCNISTQIKTIKNINDDLEFDMVTCIQRAKSLILACRNCKNPVTLEKCITENGTYAKKILDKTLQSAKLKLNKIEALKREIATHHKATIRNISQIYHKKSEAFLRDLDSSISDARNGKKR